MQFIRQSAIAITLQGHPFLALLREGADQITVIILCEVKVKSVPLYSISGVGVEISELILVEGSHCPSQHHAMCTTEKWQASTGGLLHIAFSSSVQLYNARRKQSGTEYLFLYLKCDTAGNRTRDLPRLKLTPYPFGHRRGTLFLM